jgi:hypothetical protein
MGSRGLRRSVDAQDLCAIGHVGWNRSFSISDLVDKRSPRLSPHAARTLIRRLVYSGVLKKDGRGKFTPTVTGWQAIERASCKR